MPHDPALVPFIIGALAHCAFALDFAGEAAVDPDDELILVEQLDAAGAHIATAAWALHPRWYAMEPAALEAEALDLFRRHRPQTGSDLPCYVRAALEACADGARAGRGEVAAELTDAADHLEVALYLLSPSDFDDRLDAMTPIQRLEMLGRIDEIETIIDEHRQILRRAAQAMGN